MLARERFLAACRNQPVDRPPVWLMRQAGRYLPEYRALRGQHPFWEMLRRPELSVELALQPLRRFGVDAAILFSDILVVLDAMGAEVRYLEGGPVISPLVSKESDLKRLSLVSAEKDFAYIAEAMKGLCRALHPRVAIIGFAGAPFTLAAYLVEGSPGRDLSQLKALATDQPVLYKNILTRIADVVYELLTLQIRNGADAVQLFDTWVGKLSKEEYTELAVPYARQVIERLSGWGVPVILYVRGAAEKLETAASSGCGVLSVDSSVSLSAARSRLGAGMVLQGNFDPLELCLAPEQIRARVHQMIDEVQARGYIVNLGQGMVPSTPLEGVEALVKAVREWSA